MFFVVVMASHGRLFFWVFLSVVDGIIPLHTCLDGLWAVIAAKILEMVSEPTVCGPEVRFQRSDTNYNVNVLKSFLRSLFFF